MKNLKFDIFKWLKRQKAGFTIQDLINQFPDADSAEIAEGFNMYSNWLLGEE